MRNRYVNFFTDFAFKRLFGSEMSKNILLDFLNELLYQEQGRIVSLNYMKNEQVGRSEFDRKAIYDLYCENERGEKFIVEIQRASHKYFKDRTLFYSTFPIVEQAKKGDWDYKLTPVYVIAILGFIFDDDEGDPEKYRYDVKLMDIDTGKQFYDKLTFIYLQMPKFTKQEYELSNRFEKWLYVLKNLPSLERIPDMAREKVFEEFFRLAEIAEFTKDERDAYDDSLKVMWDNYAVLTTALEEAEARGEATGLVKGEAIGEAKGKAEGLAEGKAEGLAEGEARGLMAGKLEASRTLLLELLAERFGEIPGNLKDKLFQINNDATLRKLSAALLRVESLNIFEEAVENI